MRPCKIAFFDTKPYDREFFDEANKEFGDQIKYFVGHLTTDTVELAAAHEVVCAFVNDTLSRTVIDSLDRKSVV
jgi:D-lactate dehydrogenase